jgi:hypothetical protein
LESADNKKNILIWYLKIFILDFNRGWVNKANTPWGALFCPECGPYRPKRLTRLYNAVAGDTAMVNIPGCKPNGTFTPKGPVAKLTGAI